MRKLICLLLMLTMLPLPALAEQPETTLMIGGFITADELSEFTRENPDILVQSVAGEEVYYETNALIQALTTGDATYDVLVTSTQTINLPSLMEKGFAAPLDASPLLRETFEGMYPFLKEAVSCEGVCYGLPLYLYNSTLSYFPASFEATGLDVPASWEELAALINDFPNQPEEIREEYEPVMWITQYRDLYFMRMVEAYAVHMQATGQELRFDTPLFRELMALVENLTEENDVEEEREAEPLMQTVDILQYGYEDMARLLPLSMGGHTSIGVSATVAIINPYSEHIPEAIRLLEYLAGHYTPAVRLTILQDGNVPVAYEQYDRIMADWEAEKARLEQALEEGDPADERGDRDALNQHMQKLEGIERWQHWVLSAETIAAWQEVAPYLIVTQESPLQYQDVSGQFPAQALMWRYMDGELPTDQFIRQMDEKCQMMLLERQ